MPLYMVSLGCSACTCWPCLSRCHCMMLGAHMMLGAQQAFMTKAPGLPPQQSSPEGAMHAVTAAWSGFCLRIVRPHSGRLWPYPAPCTAPALQCVTQPPRHTARGRGSYHVHSRDTVTTQAACGILRELWADWLPASRCHTRTQLTGTQLTNTVLHAD